MGTVLISVKKTPRLITVEEGCKNVGVGAEISARVIEQALDCLDTPITRVAAKDVPDPCSRILEQAVISDTQDIIKAVRRSLQG